MPLPPSSPLPPLMPLSHAPLSCQAFWSRFHELVDWEKVIKNIEKGEQKIQRQADIMAAIKIKMGKYKKPWSELKVNVWYMGNGK